MRVAVVGTRGIPANYGGFETFAEELSSRLVARGHRVTVYCRSNDAATRRLRRYRGVDLVHLPTIRHKYLDTIVHTGLATGRLLFGRFDIALYCNGANAIYTALPRLVGTPTALNVDGLERRRTKWNAAARAWYLLSERLATFLPSAVVSDARVIERYYLERYNKASTFIPYGADLEPVETKETLVRLGLEPGGYFLYVSRLEPENNALLVVQAFERAELRQRLVVVGDAPYAADYIQRVRSTQDPRILCPGAIYGQGYRELQSHCFAYIHATEVGGTHPALIEAMGRGVPVLYLETPENSEVAGGVAWAYSKDPAQLAAALERLADLPAEDRRRLGDRGREVARQRYDWEAVTGQYESLFRKLAG